MRHHRAGFTLIELMIVVAIIGILATIAIPRLNALKERGYRASMISDLKNMVVLQEGHFSVAENYAHGVQSGPEVFGRGNRGRLSFTPSPGNDLRVRRRNGGAALGWSATVRNPMVTSRRGDVCGIFIGPNNYAPNRAVTEPGVPACY